ncbi:MAG: 50S ribosomal protein L10 [Burkholderiales bacterium]
MGLNLEEKKTAVAEISAKLAGAQAVVVAEYRGLEVEGMTELRRKARASGVYLRVLKNTLARRAVKDTPFEQLADHLVGPLIYGISTDPVASAKVLNDFAKDNEKIVLKAGAMPGSLLSATEVKSLATMPSRDELIAMLMRTMQAPVAQFVRTLNEVPARFARTLAAVHDARAKQAA